MKAFKKGLSLAVVLAMALQALVFTPVLAEEVVTPVELGEPAYMYNVLGDPLAVTDGDSATTWNFDRRKLGASWISALVYDAGDGMTFDFNRITLSGTGCRFYGANEEGDLADIGAALAPDTDYSGDDGYQAFADILGIDPIGSLVNQGNKNSWTDDKLDLGDALSYRYFVVVPYAGWTNANVGEVSVSLVEDSSEPEPEPETRTVTFDEKVTVTVDGETIASGDSVEVGKLLEIAPIVPDGEELVSVTVNGEEIEEPYVYEVADENVVIEATFRAVEPDPGPQEPQLLQDLGEPAYIFNSVGGNAANMTDGSVDTAYHFGRGDTAPSWIVAAVYDAGELNRYQFNKISLNGTGVFVYGANEEGQLADIASALDAETNYSTDINLFAEALGVEAVCDLKTGNTGGEAQWKGDVKEYRYIVIAVYGGWPNADVKEVTLELVPQEELEKRTVTFGENVKVTVDGVEIASGDQVEEGKILEIAPVLAEGETLGQILVNGAAIDGNTYTVGGENISIEITLVEKRAVTFDDNVKVTAGGQEIVSGSLVPEGTELTIEAVLSEGEILNRILVNGTAISGNTYTVGGEDVNIVLELAEIDPDQVPLGKAAYVYNIPYGNVDYLTDGSVSTGLEFSRKNLADDTWISVVVYDAGEGKTFDFSRIELASRDRVRFYATNEAVNGDFNLLDISGTIEHDHDYSQDEYFAQCFGLTALGDLANSSKTFDDVQSYRYFVAAFSDGWANNTLISEITISNKIIAASLGEVVRTGGEYANKSGKWSSTNFNAQWSVTDDDLGIVAGTSENLALWGWIGGDGSDAGDAGVVTYRLKSETETYADVKIVGNEKRDDRDFTVWVEGEDGQISQGYTLTTGQGESLGNLTLYTVKNVRVFEGVNKVTIGSSQFGYSPDFAMAVFVDKADSFLRVGELRLAEGEAADKGDLAVSDKFIEEFLPGVGAGSPIGGLAAASEMTAEVMSSGGTYNLIALADEGTLTLDIDGAQYSARAGDTEYSSLGGLRAAVFKNVVLSDGIGNLTLTGSGIVGIKLIEQRSNTVTFGDEIAVVADGKIVNSGETVADGTTVNITAFTPDGKILDRILVNGKEISDEKYFVFNEDIEIKAEFIDVMYVTVTFDEGIVVMANGNIIESGAQVRGDASLRFAAGNSAEIKAVFSVNGTPISGNTYTLNKQDVHISVELTPYDLIYLQEYMIELFDESETAMRFLLPSRGEYGAEVTWAITQGAEGDFIDESDGRLLLTADLSAGREAREIKLTASITVGGQEYTVEKTVTVESNSLVSIGGRDFFISPIGNSAADLTIDDGQFVMSGLGNDLWTAPDGFGYLYTRLSDEDFTISIKADKLDGSSQWRRTGLMLRESTDPGARFVMLSLGADNGAGLELAVRNTPNAAPYHIFRDTGYVRGRSSFGYIKLEKKGDFITAYYSEDGEDYTALNAEPVEFAFEGQYLAGVHRASDSGYAYLSRFEINGEDVMVSGDITGAAYSPADGKLLVTWNDPTQYSTFSFDSITVTASADGAEPVSVEAAKGEQRAVLEGLENDVDYTLSIQAKTALLCDGGENNAVAYNAVSKAVTLTARPFDAAAHAAITPQIDMTLSDLVMVGERNQVSLAFAQAQPASAFELTVRLPEGVGVQENSISLSDGCSASLTADGLKITYSGDNRLVTDIASFVAVTDAIGGYSVTVDGTVSFYSFEDGVLSTAPATLASAQVTVVDVQYVTLTFDSRITAVIDGKSVTSGSVVRGDSVIELSCGVPEGAEITYIVNGEPIEGSTVTLRRVDTHIDVEIVPLDVKYIRELEMTQKTETEAGVIFDLPLRGQYGSNIEWKVKDNVFGDTIAEVDYMTARLTVNMADNDYQSRSVVLVASVTFGGQVYTIEKTVYAQTGILHRLGGRNFFLRQVGQDDQSTAKVQIANDQIALSGYGTDLWAAPDSFGYFYTKSDSEDYAVTVKIDRQEGANQWRRSGLMFRQSDSENEKMVMLDVGANNGAALEYAYRVGTTGSATQLARSYNHGSEIWLRLEKKGNKFYAYYSTDGETFSLVSEAPATVRMDGEYLVGIFSETETGQTYFSRLALNGSDVFVSEDITNAAATSSDGKIRVTWTDPTEDAARSFEDILVTLTDSLGRQRSAPAAKGVQELTFDGLTNGLMYTVTVQARTGELCAAAENGATAYRALSAPVTLRAFPVDFEYMAAIRPMVNMTGKNSLVVGQAGKIKMAFADIQPIYGLSLSVEIPSGLDVRDRDISLSEEFSAAGGSFELKNGVLTLSYQAANTDSVIYITDLAEITFGAEKKGGYTLRAEGQVNYYSFELGELSTSVNSDSVFEISVESSGSTGGGRGSGGSGGGGGSTGGSGSTVFTPFTAVDQTVPKIPDGAEVFADKAEIPAWAATAVSRLAERGIISGSDAGAGLMFRPNAAITREEFVKLCVEAFMKADPAAKCDFVDVDENAWYYPYVATMTQTGILQGYSDGRFGIGDYITRQDMAVIVYRLFRTGYIDLTSGPVSRFDDNDSIADYALEAVTALRAAGVVSGYSGNTFAPADNLTRAMAAQILYGCLN